MKDSFHESAVESCAGIERVGMMAPELSRIGLKRALPDEVGLNWFPRYAESWTRCISRPRSHVIRVTFQGPAGG